MSESTAVEMYPSQKRVEAAARRGVDVLAASVGLLVLAPVFGVLGVLVKAQDRGPVWYRSRRVGQYGAPFDLYKFRTMAVGADRKGGGITVSDDPRVTRVGRMLRRYKLDELPQLVNVVKGEMSLVGPRPEDPRYVARYTPEQRQVLAVRPGITSPASLAFRHEEQLLTGADWETTYCTDILPAKLAMELAYLRQRTLWKDVRLMARTILTLFQK